MSVHAQIGRIDIALHGVSADLARAAADGLEEELRRRLAALRPGPGPFARRAGLGLAELSLSPLILRSTLDAGALRALLAEHIALALGDELGATPDEPAARAEGAG